MQREIILIYLKTIEDKLKFIIEKSNVIRNELLLYIEKIIDILNMLNKNYHENLEEITEVFKMIQETVLLKDYDHALEFTQLKIKELADGKSH